MRRDIQFLRGIAVLAVVLYHAGLPFIANGYLGVDIFFVISGFLITSIILKGLAGDDFSFSYFYLRRARRLLPALYSTLAMVTLVSYLVLTDRQWEDYRNQLYGALTFTSNIVLPLQVGYFEDAAETKPLLHIWSLSLEEQYYLILPLILFLTRQSYRGVMLFALAAISLVLCQMFVSRGFEADWLPQNDSSVWAFYLLPTRAWQLLAGSLVAWQMFRFPTTEVPRIIKFAALLGLLALLCFSIDEVAVRGNAIAASLLTAILLLGRDNWLPDKSPINIIERIGDWSYSLYLIHWPLLAFAQIAFLGSVPPVANLLALVVSFLLAYLQYQYVEQRFRHVSRAAKPVSTVAPLAAFTILLVVASLPLAVNFYRGNASADKNLAAFRKVNIGFDWRCTRGKNYADTDFCRTSSSPRVAVWGDSLAMHLVPGLLKNEKTRDSLVQITRSGCNPIHGLTEANFGDEVARACVEFNAGAINYIVSSDSIETVIIGSPFGYFYGGGGRYYFEGEIIDRDPQFAAKVLVETVQSFEEAGKRVVIFSPPPSADFDVGECLERQYNGAITLGRKGCEIGFDSHLTRMGPVIRSLELVQNETSASVIWLSDELCDEVICRTELNAIPLYRDRLHLSVPGSETLLGRLDFN